MNNKADNKGAFLQPLLQWKIIKCYLEWVSEWEREGVCVCSLSYPACYVHAPYCHLWPAGSRVFIPYYFINGTIFGKRKLLKTKCMFWFSPQLLSETVFILRTERDMIINVYWSVCKVPDVLVRVKWNLNFATIFFKILNIKLHEDLSNGSRVVPCGRTDGRTWRS
jgi:hypothetical protein